MSNDVLSQKIQKTQLLQNAPSDPNLHRMTVNLQNRLKFSIQAKMQVMAMYLQFTISDKPGLSYIYGPGQRAEKEVFQENHFVSL